VVFIQKGIEIRPDQLGTLLLLISTLSLMLAMESNKWRGYIILAGATTALSMLATQKVLLAVPGLAITFFMVFAQRRMPARNIVQGCGIFAGGAVVVTLPLLFYFWSHGALGDFIEDNFRLGAKWPHEVRTFISILSQICKEDGLFIFLVGIGLIECLKLKPDVAMWRLAILAPLFSMMLFMPVFPVVQSQYIFLFLPYVAILGGIGAVFVARPLAEPKYKILQPILIIFLAIVVHGVPVVKIEWGQKNAVTLDVLRYVVEQTPPSATVMRAWSTGVAFRRPAYFYFSLHDEIQAIIPDKSYAQLRDGLRSGSIVPEIIEMDESMKQMPREIVDILRQGWEPTGIDTLWRRQQNVGSP
jgi:4-amino-4-deoxy-L-arabinose transferase-like glycosyltransferase